MKLKHFFLVLLMICFFITGMIFTGGFLYEYLVITDRIKRVDIYELFFGLGLFAFYLASSNLRKYLSPENDDQETSSYIAFLAVVTAILGILFIAVSALMKANTT